MTEQALTTPRRDRLAGAALALLGFATAVQSWGYGTGTLLQMGPGFFPFALGCLLAMLGLLVVATTSSAGAAPGATRRPEWRGWGCIVGGMVAFLVLGHFTGLLLATFACVLISALGDRSIRWREALILSSGVTLFGVIVFSYLLGIPMPLFRWVAS